MKRVVACLVIGVLGVALNTQPVKAEEFIVIDTLGDVTPSDAPIQPNDDKTIYTFTDNIDCNGISVQISSIIIDGNECTLRGRGVGNGFNLTGINNVTIKNTFIRNFNLGISLTADANNNTIYRNKIANCTTGITVGATAFNNQIYQNNFIDNTIQALDSGLNNTWYSDYLDGGNYWSDHEFSDNLNGLTQDTPGRDGICDGAYNANNVCDEYPLMEPYLLSVRNTETGSEYYTIQEALDDASEGDTIRVFSGAHYENIDIDKPLQLIGDDAGTTTIDGVRKQWIEQDDVVKIDANNIRVEGLRIQNAGDDCYGLNLSGFEYNQIISNTIANNPNGVSLDGSNYNSIVDNTITLNANVGIDVNDSNNILITKNRINLNDGFGIVIADSNTLRVVNNCLASNGYGIHIKGSSYDNEIRGNKVLANGSIDLPDIGCFAGQWLTNGGIGDLDCSGKVNFVDFALLAHRWLAEEDGDGIVLHTPVDANTTILSNTVAFHNNGIELGGTSGNRITDNVLIHNLTGLRLTWSAPNNVIVNNVARLNRDHGIYLNDSNNVLITGNEISNGKLDGIYLAWSNNVSITENKIHDNEGCGIMLSAYSDDFNIMGNILTSNLRGIYSSGSSGGTITKNRIKHNSGYGIKLDGCENNTIYHNIFVENTTNAEDDNSDLNQWYNVYECYPNSPSGGNFWDDYEDKVEPPVDANHGLNLDSDGRQHGEGPDFPNCCKYGIADKRYPVDSDTIDKYPLILVGAKITPARILPNLEWLQYIRILYPIFPASNVPYTPKMGRPYIVDVNLHNTAGDLADGPGGEVYYGGIKQATVRAGSWLDWVPDLPEADLYGWITIGGWSLDYNIENEPCDPPFGIEPCDVNEFNPKFTNSWNWIMPNSWQGVVISIIGAIPKLPGATGVSVGSFILSCYNASKAVPSMTYTFEHMEETEGPPHASDIIIFSKDITVKVPREKLAYLRGSLAMQVCSIGCSISATACLLSSFPPTQALAPTFWAASAAFTAGSIVAYYMAEDPNENYTQIFEPSPVPVPDDINELDEGIAKRLALAVLDLSSLEHAYGESYIRYDGARAADDNEPNEYYMGLQLGAALKYNAMATNKLQDVQFLSGLLTAHPNMPSPTYGDVDELWWNIYLNGLPQIQKEILHVFDFNEPPDDPNDPNRPSADDIRDVMLELINTPELVELCLQPDNLHKYLHTITQGRYIAEHALEVTAEAENLLLRYLPDVAITDVWPSAAEVLRGGEVLVNVEVQTMEQRPKPSTSVPTPALMPTLTCSFWKQNLLL